MYGDATSNAYVEIATLLQRATKPPSTPQPIKPTPSTPLRMSTPIILPTTLPNLPSSPLKMVSAKIRKLKTPT